MPGPREVIEGVLRDCAPLVADRPHAAGALARVLLVHLGRAGLLPDCPMTWDTEWLAHDDHHHRCGSFEDHPGRCSCIVDGCRSWRSR